MRSVLEEQLPLDLRKAVAFGSFETDLRNATKSACSSES
jgi:hypothetical protein